MSRIYSQGCGDDVVGVSWLGVFASCCVLCGGENSGAVKHRIYETPFADVYPLYVAKVERKGRTKGELHEVIRWLTGFTEASLKKHISKGSTFSEFFGAATLHPNSKLITGSVCGVKVQEVKDPLMRKIRYLDKLVDELAKGKPVHKVLRS